MIGVSTSPFNLSMLRKTNIWYSVKDGNWFDKTTWRSNGLKRNSFPQLGDDVVIAHKVVWDFADSPNAGLLNARVQIVGNTIRNLYITGSGIFNSSSLGNQVSFFVNGNVQCDGTFDWSMGSTGGGQQINIAGTNNWFNTFVPGNSSSNITVNYNSLLSYAIPSANYYSLQLSGNNWIEADLSINGVLSVNGKFELGAYNFTAADLNIGGTLSKSSSTGVFTVTNAGSLSSSILSGGTISFTSSPTINWTGNLSCDLRTGVNFGSGTFNILANCNIALSNAGNSGANFGTNNVVIAAGKTVTLTGAAPWLNNGSVTGGDSSSTLNVNTTYAYGNNNPVMPTGIFNYNHSGTSTIYIGSGVTIDVPFGSFYNLEVDGTATLAANCSISNVLNINGTLQLSTYDFTSSGTINNSGSILKSGTGTVTIGVYNAQNATGKLDFSSGNPTVNLSGNISGDVRIGLNFGSGSVNITQNLNIGITTSGNAAPELVSNFVIASGKTLTNVGLSSTSGGITIDGGITGADSTAIFDNRSVCIWNTAGAPMTTGKLYCNQATNTFIYGMAGNQDIQVPSDPTTPAYENLLLEGSGAKTLLGNTVANNYTLESPATLNSNGFSLT